MLHSSVFAEMTSSFASKDRCKHSKAPPNNYLIQDQEMPSDSVCWWFLRSASLVCGTESVTLAQQPITQFQLVPTPTFVLLFLLHLPGRQIHSEPLEPLLKPLIYIFFKNPTANWKGLWKWPRPLSLPAPPPCSFRTAWFLQPEWKRVIKDIRMLFAIPAFVLQH